MAKTFTQKQGQYPAFIDSYTRLHRRPPAESDLQHYFGVTPPTVHNMVVRLTELGLIWRAPGQARTMRVLVDEEEIPRLARG